MGINKSVFASKAERSHYEKLSRNWGSKYNIWHNLPYLNVFNVNNIIDVDDYMSRVSLAALGYNESIKTSPVKLLAVSDKDKNILKKTSIDYTVCNQNDEPILCIEFDGLGEGFNREHPTFYSIGTSKPFVLVEGLRNLPLDRADRA
ncbi:hypothetical protein [Chamaesiphon sp. OTE_8_metabat_110]|uniref:hypothetical protein n=1 Tax=Chamaesiphon sp. OTE_8_metabat_110 TaxID=2964696 RepID=UPI00286BAD94|nr:hypothetical protein [Chamaesiphon sp. OTE_8_metabat_110]